MKKYKKHSILARLMYAKTIGLFIGILAAVYVCFLSNSVQPYFGAGLIVFYTILGAIIAQTGVMTKHPILNFKLSFWVRGAILGVSMHLMLVFLAFEEITVLVKSYEWFQSPFWILIDGAIIGIFIDWITTKYAGEGEKLPME